MSKKIQDYLHLYGTGVIVFFDRQNWRVTEFRRKTVKGTRTDQSHSNEFYYHECRPILRPLSDMTDEERVYLGFSAMIKDEIIWTPEKYRYAISRGFDLFNLINEGLAIDKTKQP
jgi:hypothetical protein